MKFRSVKNESPPVAFREALFRGIAPDGGLYVPETIPALPQPLLNRIGEHTLQSAGELILSGFIDDIPAGDLRSIVDRTLNFPIPLVNLQDGLFLLELFHGPTLSFKDVGARFMANACSHFLSAESRELTVLVATSGDTGSAVAHGFHDIPRITVYILYPSGRISPLQERHMTTLGGNIRAVEVKGTFDDCQLLVKQTLADPDVRAARALTTANSMNVGRLLPQIIYHVWGVAQLLRDTHLAGSHPSVVVPSGNLGNLTAAAYAKRMGAPIGRLLAATNENDIVPQYLKTGVFSPRTPKQTPSTAMDVGNPSNLARLQSLYRDDPDRLRQEIEAISISDEDTLREIRSTHKDTGHLLDPHTAVGVAAARHLMRRDGSSSPIIIAATAHPGKFPETVGGAIGATIPLPTTLAVSQARTRRSTPIFPAYNEWKKLLLGGTASA